MPPTTLTIPDRYLLVTNIPFWRGDAGQSLAPELWWKDLLEHLHYLPRLHVAAPTTTDPSSEPLRRVADLPPLSVTLLPERKSLRHAVLTLPKTISRLWRAAGQSDIVHCGVAGWPIPTGWLAAPIARLRGKFLVVVVESAPWRTERSTLRRIVYERLAKWCLDLAHVSFFTQAEYRQSLLPRRRQRGHVIHASWVDASRVLSDAAAEQLWNDKPTAPKRLLFAGRLADGKGVRILLDAMTRVTSGATLDILGAGDLSEECRRAADASNGRINLLGTLPYDDRFFAALRPYHAVVVPSLGDEQPRIVYDAYSQAIPVLASDTPGLRDCVRDNATGILLPTGNAAALAAAIDRVTPTDLRRMGLASLAAARAMTHTAMHSRRADILQRALSEYHRGRA